ncbi:OLC1v1030332C1 [Oldenlandia corymbosa var. corymbosa]|uniref:OLC1v1030332C1 n=1 Tax=Oldenlandia corymbosa var. corymbosa TaxID=529605 RepID=A0AAV1CJ48_OLDCO|nr:OLC1v1030332C1 [Oldenlandia corymbosa var. corymbosa]
MQLTDYHIQLSRDNLKLSLLGYLIDDFDVDDKIMRQYIVANWPVTVRVPHYDRNFFVLKFMNRYEMMAILDNGSYVVNGSLLILRRCNDHEDLALDSIKIEKLSIWVRMHGVPITSMNYRALEDLASRIGEVACIKQDCVFLRKITYIRAKAWIKPGDPLVPYFHFTKRNGKVAKIHCKAHAHKKKRWTCLPDYKVEQMLDFYDSVPDEYVQDGFTISARGRMAAPAAGEDSDSLHSVGQGDIFHSFSSYSSEFYQNSKHSFPDDASEFYMPSSFYEILDVPPFEEMLADQSYVLDLFIPNGPDYPIMTFLQLLLLLVFNQVLTLVIVKMSSIPVATLGCRPFKRQGSCRSLSSISAPLPPQDDYPQTNSDADDFYMRARRAVSKSHMSDPPQKPLDNPGAHYASTAILANYNWSSRGGISNGWRMKVDDAEFDEVEDSETSEALTDSRKRGSDDSLASLERPGKKRSSCAVDEEVKNLFQALEMAWETSEPGASASAQLNDFAVVEPDQLPLFP